MSHDKVHHKELPQTVFFIALIIYSNTKGSACLPGDFVPNTLLIRFESSMGMSTALRLFLEIRSAVVHGMAV